MSKQAFDRREGQDKKQRLLWQSDNTMVQIRDVVALEFASIKMHNVIIIDAIETNANDCDHR